MFFILQNVQAVRNLGSCQNNFHCLEIIFLVLALAPFQAYTFVHFFVDFLYIFYELE